MSIHSPEGQFLSERVFSDSVTNLQHFFPSKLQFPYVTELPEYKDDPQLETEDKNFHRFLQRWSLNQLSTEKHYEETELKHINRELLRCLNDQWALIIIDENQTTHKAWYNTYVFYLGTKHMKVKEYTHIPLIPLSGEKALALCDILVNRQDLRHNKTNKKLMKHVAQEAYTKNYHDNITETDFDNRFIAFLAEMFSFYRDAKDIPEVLMQNNPNLTKILDKISSVVHQATTSVQIGN